MFLTVANPNAADTTVDARYLLPFRRGDRQVVYPVDREHGDTQVSVESRRCAPGRHDGRRDAHVNQRRPRGCRAIDVFAWSASCRLGRSRGKRRRAGNGQEVGPRRRRSRRQLRAWRRAFSWPISRRPPRRSASPCSSRTEQPRRRLFGVGATSRVTIESVTPVPFCQRQAVWSDCRECRQASRRTRRRVVDVPSSTGGRIAGPIECHGRAPSGRRPTR